MRNYDFRQGRRRIDFVSRTIQRPIIAYAAAGAQAPAVASSHKLVVHRLMSVAGTILFAGTLLLVLLFAALTVGPRFLPYQVYTVLSGSMEPTIPTGSMIILEMVEAGDLAVGDIITMMHPEKKDVMITHRIVEIQTGENGRGLVTKGDANNATDNWIVNAKGSGWRYVFGFPAAGYVLNWLQSPLGRMFSVVVPSIALGIMLLIDIWKPRKES